MNPQTLLILEKDHKKFSKWVHQLGMRAKNIQYVRASKAQDVLGYDPKETYFMVMDFPSIELIDLVRDLGYGEIHQSIVESKLKKMNEYRQAPTQ